MKVEGNQPSQIAALLALERRHSLFNFKIDGWSVWRVLRNPLHRQAESLPLIQPAHANTARVVAAIQGTLRLLWLLISCGHRELLIKTCRSGLRMSDGARFRDVYFDGLLATGRTYLKLEVINSPEFEQQAAFASFPAHLDSVVFTFWGLVLARLLPVRSAHGYCVRVAELIRQEAGLNVSSRFLMTRISTAYWQARLYALLLRRLRPKAALVSDTGEYGLNIACKRHGVQFIELQHGVFNADHPDAIPTWVEGTSAELLLPDALACRGDYWIEQLATTRQGRDHAHAVGNELIDLARCSRSNRGTRTVLRIILTSQGLDSVRLAKWVADFASAAPVNISWHLVIKLHPVYDSGNRSFDSYGDPRISVIGGAALPNIFDLLADADLHLSIASACHFDAAALGVPSVVIPLDGHETMLKAIDSRLIYLANQPRDAWRFFLGSDVGTYARRYSEPGFIYNLERLLKEGLKKAAP